MGIVLYGIDVGKMEGTGDTFVLAVCQQGAQGRGGKGWFYVHCILCSLVTF